MKIKLTVLLLLTFLISCKTDPNKQVDEGGITEYIYQSKEIDSNKKSPIQFLNHTYTINIDTSYGSKTSYERMINTQYRRAPIQLKDKFINTGEHKISVDSVNFPFPPYAIHTNMSGFNTILGNDTSMFVLELNKFLKGEDIYNRNISKRDTSFFINIPFFSNGKVYQEKVKCNYIFGKSKLISKDSFIQIVDDSVALHYRDSSKYTFFKGKGYPRIKFRTHYSITNITKSQVQCTDQLQAWNDMSHTYHENQRFLTIPPLKSYKIPIQMNMSSKCRFERYGEVILFSEDVFEIHKFIIKSNFRPETDLY